MTLISFQVQNAHKEIHEALLNNFDYAAAMNKLRDIMTRSNSYMAKCEKEGRGVRVLILRKAAFLISKFLRIFGVIDGHDDLGFSAGREDSDPSVLFG